jgi:hypothetical protein
MTQPTITSGGVFTFEMLGRPILLRPVNLLGQWTQTFLDPQPGRHPSEFQDPQWDLNSREAVAQYLDTGLMYNEAMTSERCRMGCGKTLHAFQHFTDGYYAWTGALSHYVRDHHLRTPDLFTDHALRPHALPPRLRNHMLRLCARLGVGLLVSDTWWLTLQGWGTAQQGRID